METANRTWEVFDEGLPVLTYPYSFGAGFATALAVGVPRGVIVVSPPCSAPSSAFDDLERNGEVVALVAPNAFHTMGIRPWKARFPHADVFAPAQSIPRVQKVAKVAGVRPLVELAALAGTNVAFIDMPHYRTGEALVRMQTSRGLAWYVTDVFMNLPELPRQPIARLLFGVTGSAPGPRFNAIAPLFMMKDKLAVRRWLSAEADRQKPRWLIPAHGGLIDLEANGDARRELLKYA